MRREKKEGLEKIERKCKREMGPTILVFLPLMQRKLYKRQKEEMPHVKAGVNAMSTIRRMQS